MIEPDDCIKHEWRYAASIADDIRGLRIILFCAHCAGVLIRKVETS